MRPTNVHKYLIIIATPNISVIINPTVELFVRSEINQRQEVTIWMEWYGGSCGFHMSAPMQSHAEEREQRTPAQIGS